MMLVKNGQSVATVVLSAQATEVARYAARELTYHVEKATGAQLNIVAEGGEPADTAGKIYLGPTSAARNAGIDPEKLLPDSFTLLTKDNALFIVGRDSEATLFRQIHGRGRSSACMRYWSSRWVSGGCGRENWVSTSPRQARSWCRT